MAISVVIAAGERTLADALAARLDTEDDIAVLAAVRVTPGLASIAARSAEVTVLDGDLPGGAASRLCEAVRRGADSSFVIMLSSSSEPERIAAAVRAGAAAWVRKDESIAHLLHVIRGVAQGETWLPAAETGSVIRLLIQDQQRQQESARLLSALTPRERTVLACLADGAAGRDVVAKELHLSVHTVGTHLRNIMAKLGVHSALEAVALTRVCGSLAEKPAERGHWRSSS